MGTSYRMQLLRFGIGHLLTFLFSGLVALNVFAAGEPPQTISNAPSEEDIREIQVFDEPLLACGTSPSAEQNQRLLQTLKRYQARAVPDDFSEVENYLRENSSSPWAPPLTFNLGCDYYRAGFYSKALEAWERAWSLFKECNDPRAKPLADRSAGELARMYSRLGRVKELASLMASLESRPLVGPATECVAGARQSLWTMENDPGASFRCGPLALGQILAISDPKRGVDPLILNARSSKNGFSLTEVFDLSQKLNMNCQMAFREPGSEVVIPALVHWKAGHFAALVKEENGRLLLKDPTFGNDTWMSKRALDDEASGYMLIPSRNPPTGWRPVSRQEGDRVFGKGLTTDNDPDATTCYDLKAKACIPCGDPPPGMAEYNIHLMVVSLNIRDAPVGYQPPVGPNVRFTATYSQREAGQPAAFPYSNLGPKWTFNFLAYITDSPDIPNADVKYYTAGGGSLPFTGFDQSSQRFRTQLKSQSVLRRTSSSSYDMELPDGSIYTFNLSQVNNGLSRRIFLTQIADPQGNALRIRYDARFRVISVTDSIGQATLLSYENSTDSRKITQVTDPFGRFATFNYDSQGRLVRIVDSIGLVSSFKYDSGDFITSMTTPYGTTSFQKGEIGTTRWLEVTYPNQEKERVEFSASKDVGVPYYELRGAVPKGQNAANYWIYARNTYYWDRLSYPQYLASPNDYRSARMYHWLHNSFNVLTASGILESTKMPLENRVWYTYKGQDIPINTGDSAEPTTVGRVLDDGTSKLSRFDYNEHGRVTRSIDPIGRTTSYVYAPNEIDLVEVRQTTAGKNDLLGRFAYNAQHLPVAIWDAAGQMTTNTYNPRGQLLTSTNPRQETHTFEYDQKGYLITIDGPLPGTTDSSHFTYDEIGRLRTVTNPDGYSVTNTYDNFDRLIKTVFPDGTFTEATFDKLDRSKIRDRIGRETAFYYNELRQLVATQDPLGRITRFDYCNCGSLSALIDPMGRMTRWEHDLQGRITAKIYADGSRISYRYEKTKGRLKSVTDEKGQLKVYDYNIDGSLRRVSYPNAQIPTATVTYEYDLIYSRVISMQDGIGTTRWTYGPVGARGALQTVQVSGPWPNETVSYEYDELGRPTKRTINGSEETSIFDSLGRVTNVINALGTFRYAYDGATSRLVEIAYPNGQVSHYSYFDKSGDHRLQEILHRGADSSVISRFNYEYDASGTITKWGQEIGDSQDQLWHLEYDSANQLKVVSILQGTVTNETISFEYDASGNRTRATEDRKSIIFGYNALNQITSSASEDPQSRAYEWDAEHRLVAINFGSKRSEFSYDGEGHRVAIDEKENGVVVNQKHFVWCAGAICAERSSQNEKQKEFFSQGAVLASTPMFYTRDHLGSVRELLNSDGLIRARYAYSPYGLRRTLSGDDLSDFGFTGHYQHKPSGIDLTIFRAYEPGIGRWLSRDPVGESAGYNLYSYVGNSPIGRTDPLGLDYLGDYLDAVVNSYYEHWLPMLQDLGYVSYGLQNPSQVDPSRYAAAGRRLFSDAAEILQGLGPEFSLDTCLASSAEATLSRELAGTFSRGKYMSAVLQQDMVAYRYSGGISPAAGRFLTTADTVSQISSPAAASIALHLPENATAQTLNTFTIPAGTRIFMGGVAGGADTATQILIHDPSVLIPH